MYFLLRYAPLCLILLFAVGSAPPLLAADPLAVQVIGVDGKLLDNVKAALAPPDGLFHDGTADRLWLDYYAAQAENRARTALEPYGYYRAVITAALTGSDRDGFILRVKITPGEPVRLTQVKVEAEGPGASDETIRSALAAFPLATGQVLLQPEYETGKGKILAQTQRLGYLDASYAVHEIQIFPDTDTARITLLLKTGQRYRFGPVTFDGAPLYPEELLQRYVAFKTGAPFSYDRLGRTQANLSGTGFFSEVAVTPVKEKTVDDEIPVRITLKPAPAITLRPGVGYGTDTGVRGSLSFKELNVFHEGHVLTIEATAAQYFQGIAAGYVIPSPLNMRTMTGFKANFQHEDVSSYRDTLAALEVNRTHSFGVGLLGTAYLRFQYEQYVTGQENSSARLLMPGVRYSARRYDNIIRPTRGYDYSLELRGAHHALGSTTTFLQGIVEGAHLIPLPWRLSLGYRGKVGATWLDDPLADLPASLRFYAGGDTSVRGYSYKSLGPKNLLGEVVGGRNLLQGSVELERALFENWGVSLFYDAGNAFDSFADVRVYQGAGVGLHYYTRIGGLNLSLARQVGVSDPGYRVHFTFGFQP